MKRTGRIIFFLVLTLATLSLAFLVGGKRVLSLVPGSSSEKIFGEAEYTEGASFDAFLLKDGRLYDVYSLTPESLQEKDCPT
jgi:hypothetical protein